MRRTCNEGDEDGAACDSGIGVEEKGLSSVAFSLIHTAKDISLFAPETCWKPHHNLENPFARALVKSV